MSLLLLFANQEEDGGPALERAPRHVRAPRQVFAYAGRARIHVAAAGRSSFAAGTPLAESIAPAVAAPIPAPGRPSTYAFTGRARLRISGTVTAGFADPFAEARQQDDELLLLLE